MWFTWCDHFCMRLRPQYLSNSQSPWIFDTALPKGSLRLPENNTSKQLLPWRRERLVDERQHKIMTCLGLEGGHKHADRSVQQWCVCVCVRKSQNANERRTEIMETSWAPVISNISVWSYHSEHRLSVPLPVLDVQLDGYTATRGWWWYWKEAQREHKYESREFNTGSTCCFLFILNMASKPGLVFRFKYTTKIQQI